MLGRRCTNTKDTCKIIINFVFYNVGNFFHFFSNTYCFVILITIYEIKLIYYKLYATALQVQHTEYVY